MLQEEKSPSLLWDLILVVTFCSLSVSQRGKREEEGKKPTHTTFLQLSKEKKKIIKASSQYLACEIKAEWSEFQNTG